MSINAMNLNECPLVSVVIPVYNVEQYILQAVDSVLKQTYANLEVIIVDDESPDQSIELVKRSFTDQRIRIIKQQNRGLAGARNTGIRQAKGEFIALLDSDDFWLETKIERHMSVMVNNPHCGVSFCASQFVDEASQMLDRVQAPKKKSNFRASDIFCRNPIGNGSVPVIRKSILEQVGFYSDANSENGVPYTQYFDEALRQSEDVDCWTRIAIQTGTDFHYIDQPLTFYRLNNGGLSADVEQQFATWMHLLERLESYAPRFAEKYGPVAKAFQYRYLARRSIFQGQAQNALAFMLLAFKTKPLVLLRESNKTFETLFASIVLVLLPQNLRLRLVERLV